MVFFEYSNTILSFLYAILAIIVLNHFKKSAQRFTYFMLMVSFVTDFLTNCYYLYLIYIYGSVDNIPYPGITDWLWISTYIMVGTAVINYWISIKKSVGDNYKITLGLVIAISLLITLVINPILSPFDLISDPLVDSLYIGSSFFASIACIPLILLFKGGLLMKPWLYIGLGGLTFMIGETAWLLEMALNAMELTSGIFYIISYMLFIIGLSDKLLLKGLSLKTLKK
ncbi:MAG TPA: hypothetical protein VI790_03805 [Candidatus Nanoarchaeia archaeon]|nr:hypothetical protein [Candidatus Nanoarchaeia archaeon]